MFNRNLHHRAEVIIVLAPDRHVARVDPVLCERLCRLGVLLQEQMAVVVKVTDDRRRPALLRDALDDVGNCLGRIIVIHCDANHLRPRPRKRRYLLNRALDIRRVGIGHRLHHNRCIRPHANPTNSHCYGTTTLYLRHKLSTLKSTIRRQSSLAIHYLRRPGSSVA